MGFFFVPPGVALMLYFDIIGKEIVPIVLATTLSTMLVLVVTGWTHIMTRKIIKRIKGKNYKQMDIHEYLNNDYFLLTLTFGVYFLAKLVRKCCSCRFSIPSW